MGTNSFSVSMGCTQKLSECYKNDLESYTKLINASQHFSFAEGDQLMILNPPIIPAVKDGVGTRSILRPIAKEP